MTATEFKQLQLNVLGILPPKKLLDATIAAGVIEP